MINASLLPRVAVLRAAVMAALLAVVSLLLTAAPSIAAGTSTAPADGEKTPVDLTGATGPGSSGGGASFVRTIVGLAVVIGVIYGVAWVLRQRRASRLARATGVGLATIASVPLGPKGSVHLVRAGRDLVLVGVGEHGVTPIRTYAEEEARDAGLIDEEGQLLAATDDGPARTPGARRLPSLASLDLRPRALVDQARQWTVRR